MFQSDAPRGVDKALNLSQVDSLKAQGFKRRLKSTRAAFSCFPNLLMPAACATPCPPGPSPEQPPAPQFLSSPALKLSLKEVAAGAPHCPPTVQMFSSPIPPQFAPAPPAPLLSSSIPSQLASPPPHPLPLPGPIFPGSSTGVPPPPPLLSRSITPPEPGPSLGLPPAPEPRPPWLVSSGALPPPPPRPPLFSSPSIPPLPPLPGPVGPFFPFGPPKPVSTVSCPTSVPSFTDVPKDGLPSASPPLPSLSGTSFSYIQGFGASLDSHHSLDSSSNLFGSTGGSFAGTPLIHNFGKKKQQPIPPAPPESYPPGAHTFGFSMQTCSSSPLPSSGTAFPSEEPVLGHLGTSSSLEQPGLPNSDLQQMSRQRNRMAASESLQRDCLTSTNQKSHLETETDGASVFLRSKFLCKKGVRKSPKKSGFIQLSGAGKDQECMALGAQKGKNFLSWNELFNLQTEVFISFLTSLLKYICSSSIQFYITWRGTCAKLQTYTLLPSLKKKYYFKNVAWHSLWQSIY